MFINKGIVKSLFKLGKLFIFILILFTIFTTLPVLAGNDCELNPDAVILSVPVPGMPLHYNENCNAYEFTGEGGSLMVDYVKYLYKFLVGIAGILTVFMIMFGGVQWIFSGGSSSKISAAKETIIGAIIGLFLAVGSYGLLKTINPSLVNLSLKVVKVDTMAIGIHNEDGSCVPVEEIPCGIICRPIGDEFGDIVIGTCEFCSTSNVPGKTCGEIDTTNGETASEGSCVFSRCVDRFDRPDEACIYASEFDEPNRYINPECVGSLRLTFVQDNRTVQKNFSFTAISMVAGAKCGEIYYRDSGIFGEVGWIARNCGTGEMCVIDYSKGYNITGYQGRGMDNDTLPLENVFEAGTMNDAKCVK